MLNLLRVAGLATLAVGAVGASGHVVSAKLVTSPPTPPVTESLPPIPELVASEVAEEETRVNPIVTPPREERAASLSSLVRIHSRTETVDRQQECLAAATYFESKGEPLDGQLAVARVVLNRAESGRFASTVCGVVTQPGQFSFVRNGSMPPIARGSSNWRTAVAIAHIAQNDMWTPPAENALYFHAKRVSPSWRMTRVGSVGNHIFYR